MEFSTAFTYTDNFQLTLRRRSRRAHMKTAMCILVCLLPLLSGCIQLPVNVAEELSEADGSRPNNYELQEHSVKKPPDAAPTGERQ